MKKLFVVLMLILSGCAKQKVTHIDVYYLTTCGACHALKSELTRYQKKHSALYVNYSALYVNYYDLDDETSLKRYTKLMTQLNISENKTPLIVAKGSFVKIGYRAQDRQVLEKALATAMKGQVFHDQRFYLDPNAKKNTKTKG